MASAGKLPSETSVPGLPLDAMQEIQVVDEPTLRSVQDALLAPGDVENTSDVGAVSSAPSMPNYPVYLPDSPATSDELRSEPPNKAEDHQDVDCADSQGTSSAMSSASSQEAASDGDHLPVLAAPSDSQSHHADESPDSIRALKSSAFSFIATNIADPFLAPAAPTQSRYPNVDDSPHSEQKTEPTEQAGKYHGADRSGFQNAASGVPTSPSLQAANSSGQIFAPAASNPCRPNYDADLAGSQCGSLLEANVSSLQELSLAALGPTHEYAKTGGAQSCKWNASI